MEGQIMRKIINTIMIVAVFALGLLLAISAETKNNTKRPAEGIGIDLKKEEIPRLVDIIWIWKLVDELELREEQLTQFISRFKELRDLRGQFFRDRREAIAEMDTLLETGASDNELKSATDEFRSLETEFRQKERQLEDLLNSSLTTKQQARLIVFQDRYRRDMGRLVKNLQELSNLRQQSLKYQPEPLKKKD
jgi:Spy/CpxP family protein refolding chaperone